MLCYVDIFLIKYGALLFKKNQIDVCVIYNFCNILNTKIKKPCIQIQLILLSVFEDLTFLI